MVYALPLMFVPVTQDGLEPHATQVVLRFKTNVVYVHTRRLGLLWSYDWILLRSVW